MRIMATSGVRGGISLNESIRSSGSSGLNSPPATHDGVAQELGMLLRSHNRLDNMLNHKDPLPHRSGSAPPSVEGSLAALGSVWPSDVESETNRISRPGSGEGIVITDSEQELRSDPAYLAYYYSHINLNPRLPSPIISRDNYHLAQRLASSNFADKKKLRSFDDSNKRSLFLAQPVLPTHNEETESSEDDKSPIGHLLRQVSDNWADKGGDAFSGNSFYGLGARPKSLVDLIQQDFPRTPSPVYNQSRSSSRLANDEGGDGASGRELLLRDSSLSAAAVAEMNAALLNLRTSTSSIPLKSRSATPNSLLPAHNQSGVHSIGNISMGIPSASPGLIARAPTPDPSSAGEAFADNMPAENATSNMGARASGTGASGGAGLDFALQALSLSSRQGMTSGDHEDPSGLPLHPRLAIAEQSHSAGAQQTQRHGQRSHSQSQIAHSHILQQQQQQQFSNLEQGYMAPGKYSASSLSQNAAIQPRAGNNIYAAASAAAAMSCMAAGNPYYPNLQVGNMYAPQFGLGGYPNPTLLPGMMANYNSSVAYENAAAAAAAAVAGARPSLSAPLGGVGLDMQQLYRYTSQAGTSLQSRMPDHSYLHYLQQRSVDDLRGHDAALLRGYGTGAHMDPLELQKGQLNSSFGYPTDLKSQLARSGSLGIPMQNKSGSVSPVYYDSPPGVGFGMPYGNSPLSSPVLPGSPVVPGALSLRHAGRGSAGGAFVTWQSQRASDIGEDLRGTSLLEELKNSKTRRFELADIAGHVVEFSADQYGSRFIQQKLESASAEEKALVFLEVLPRSLTLMTDVFGNYVIQKFFEHGSREQRLELARQLIGHVLSLSLQMYGCRVIQKALEVVGLEQQILIVSELDGHVMRCVRDQNGNHVIQKCIERVPPEHIQFIISAFYGQVVMLSTHPYGCRVIQRVLEHCTDEQKQDKIMEDILCSACNLAQDQYGNYVVQHVLEHGKPHEKSEIMTKLAGQIVQMSQHKFASNVVEKCLEFGGPNERQILISEMLGLTDENEPLQAMMKDQYANYVVQKVLETCDDQQRELLLSRIRVHLHALKKYTYGKHIVARVEKLVAAGERRGAQVSA